jgi:RimJ/RimL family protein N-acetyltransferase
MSRSWPPFDLLIRTPRLELRVPTDEDVMALLDVAHAGVHAPEQMPFSVPWTDLRPPEFDQSFLGYFWNARASWSTKSWQLPLVVVRDGSAIGVQEVWATDFRTRRTVQTASWLGLCHQGEGVGTEMRAAVLHLAFEGLGALAAESGSLDGNPASARISQKLGYRPNGEGLVAPRGVPVVIHRFLLRRDDWRRDRFEVTVENLDPCLAMFGVA